jgi:hypothetical protein
MLQRERVLPSGASATIDSLVAERERLKALSQVNGGPGLTDDEQDYGHGLGSLAQAVLNSDDVEGVDYAKKVALRQIDRFGDKIKDLLAPDFKKALGIK